MKAWLELAFKLVGVCDIIAWLLCLANMFISKDSFKNNYNSQYLWKFHSLLFSY